MQIGGRAIIKNGFHNFESSEEIDILTKEEGEGLNV